MNTHDASLVDLGAASIATQGRPALGFDLGVEGIPQAIDDED